MKRILLMSLVLVFSANFASAQPAVGTIGMFADNLGNSCNFVDGAPGLCNMYGVVYNSSGSTACEFSAPLPACIAMGFLSESSPFPVKVGDAVMGTGTSIGFGTCRVGSFHALQISFFCQGLTPACCFYTVIPHQINGEVYLTDCSGPPPAKFATLGGGANINDDGSCLCNPAVKKSTWGGVKALYN